MESERIRTELLLEKAIKILEYANIDNSQWSMGGGTILMLNYHHRLSKDVDIFVSNTQYFNGLSPKLNDIAEDADFYQEGERFISLSYPEGKIDFVKAFQVSDYLPTLKHVFNQNIFVDDDIEIVTKKVFFRGASLHPRDLYDLATVYLGPRRSELVKALINIPEQLQEFHDALQRVGPGFSFSEDYGLDLVLDIPLGLKGREVDICIDLCNEVRKSLV
ncbi:MAG: nucleotidyl transferase AbiEii/AbiGii toxin family protein [Veillonella sp.]|nr:nucleotidyl transferase AbiEii/AbiGii toxin family protein [Veillonella sp.]